jgi:ABC-2 type transport system permease protein
MMLNNAAFALFWGALIARVGTIGGYGFVDIMIIWALTSTSFGIAHVLWGNVRSIGQIVMKGELDVYLLQPKNAFLNVLASRTIVSAWGDLLYGYLVLAFLPGTDPERLALFTLLALAGRSSSPPCSPPRKA